MDARRQEGVARHELSGHLLMPAPEGDEVTGVAFARGLVIALVLSAPFWLVLIGIGYLVIQGK